MDGGTLAGFPKDSMIWLQGTLEQDPRIVSFNDGNDVAYFSLVCDGGDHTRIAVPCTARNRNVEYLQRHGFTGGERLWLQGMLRVTRRHEQEQVMVTVLDMAGDFASTDRDHADV